MKKGDVVAVRCAVLDNDDRTEISWDEDLRLYFERGTVRKITEDGVQVKFDNGQEGIFTSDAIVEDGKPYTLANPRKGTYKIIAADRVVEYFTTVHTYEKAVRS